MVKTSRNNYSEAEKQRIIERFHESGLSVNQFALNEKISRANIQEWKKIGPKPPKKKTREPQYDSIGDAVCAWLMGERAKGLVVTNQDFREKARELAKLDGIPDTFKVSPGWVAKMKKRNRLTYRKAGHVSRKLAPTEKDLAEQEEFHEELQEKVVLSQTPLRNIINQDQTCMRMVSPYGLTLDKIGTKEVLTVQPGGEKNTFTVSLAIRADGSKLPAVIIFKATNKKTGVLSESIMGKLKIPNNCIVWSSLSGWWNERLDHAWIDTTFDGDGEPTVLIRDQYPVHKMESSAEMLQERNVHQIFVPAGMTGKLQPLDVGVNRPFKVFWTDAYQKWRKRLGPEDVTKSGYLRNPSRQELIDMVSECWQKVTSDCIKNSFVRAEIVSDENGAP